MITTIGAPPQLLQMLQDNVEVLVYYDGPILTHHNLSGQDWFSHVVDFDKVANNKYREAMLVYTLTPSMLKEVKEGKTTLLRAIQEAEEIWYVEDLWDRLPNGHGVPDTHSALWKKVIWQNIPEAELPTDKSFLIP